jgi:signal transduction histidine kinase
MSSEASHGGRGPDGILFNGIDSSLGKGASWRAVERRVLLSKLQDLERRARRLEYLETRLRDLSHEVQLLNRLGEVTHAIHNASDLPRLFNAVLQHALDILRADCGSVLLYESESDELVIAKACGPNHVPPEGTRVPASQGVAGHVVRHRQAVHVADIAKDGRFPVRDSGRYATGSFLSVPVQENGTFLGVLSVADRRDRSPFTTHDLRLAVAIARELAVAVGRIRQFESAQDFQRQFVSKLAHELRNPLDGALRFINLTLADHHPEERRRRYLMASKQGLERLTGIVNSLTGLSRSIRAADEEVQVNDLLRQAIVLQEGKAEQRGIGVEPDLEDGLPPVQGGAGLFQVFTNLVSNAYDAMEAGGGTLRVSSRREGDAIVVQVSDTGCGMDPEAMARLFVPFFTTKPPGKGMGLGLGVCREILGRLHGRIEAASTPGKGTTFTVTVPCVPAQEAVRL